MKTDAVRPEDNCAHGYNLIKMVLSTPVVDIQLVKNTMDRWMAPHREGYRRVLDNNEHKIKNSNTMDEWMARHGDGYRQGLDNNEYKKRMQLK